MDTYHVDSILRGKITNKQNVCTNTYLTYTRYYVVFIGSFYYEIRTDASLFNYPHFLLNGMENHDNG